MNSTNSGKASFGPNNNQETYSSVFENYEEYSNLKTQNNANDYLEKRDYTLIKLITKSDLDSSIGKFYESKINFGKTLWDDIQSKTYSYTIVDTTICQVEETTINKEEFLKIKSMYDI